MQIRNVMQMQMASRYSAPGWWTCQLWMTTKDGPRLVGRLQHPDPEELKRIAKRVSMAFDLHHRLCATSLGHRVDVDCDCDKHLDELVSFTDDL